MASYVQSNNTVVCAPFSPPIHHHSLFRKCSISLKHYPKPISNLPDSLKCKTATARPADHVAEPQPKPHLNGGEKNVISDDRIVEKIPKYGPFWQRKWMPLDLLRLVLFTMGHVMALCAPFCFSWHLVAVTVVLGFITAQFGIVLSYHRHLSHKSFTIPKWLEYIFAYCGVLAFEGNPIDWVSTHRYHHMFSDTERDPHSPREGFLFSYVSWILDRHHLTSKCGEQTNVDDLRSQPFYRFLEKTYYLHPIGFGALLYAFGGYPLLFWGLGVRCVVVLHTSFLGTSVLHQWGEQPWDTRDSSRNNWWVALLTFGDGWHNNHHAFQYSARVGLEWWQLDFTWGIIRTLQVLGLATDVKLPTEAEKKRMARPRFTDNTNLSMQIS